MLPASALVKPAIAAGVCVRCAWLSLTGIALPFRDKPATGRIVLSSAVGNPVSSNLVAELIASTVAIGTQFTL